MKGEYLHTTAGRLLQTVRQAGTSEADNEPADRLAAVKALARRCADADELRELMDMLGITAAMLGAGER